MISFDVPKKFSTSKIRCKKVLKKLKVVPMTTLLDQTAVFLYFSPAVAVQNTTPGGSDFRTPHLLQVGQSAERCLHSYVDHNSSGCYSAYEPARVSPTCAYVTFRGILSTTPMKYYRFPLRYI